MEETEIRSTPKTNQYWHDLWRIGFVLLITLTTRLWVVEHTEVLSRDSIVFIRYALQLEQPPHDPLNPNRIYTRGDVLREGAHPPGYPAAILLVSLPVRSIMGKTDCESMVASAQITSLLASLLLTIPLYFLGKLLFDRQTAFIATMLYQVLPVCTLIASDGLSDNLFLLFAALGVWFSAIALTRNGLVWFLISGLCIGASYLVRPEGLIVGIALALVILTIKYRGIWSWQPFVLRSGMVGVGLALVMVPYIITIGHLTNKPTGTDLIHSFEGQEIKPSWQNQQSLAPEQNAYPPLAEWYNGDRTHSRILWGVKALGKELLKSFFYLPPFLALFGIYISRRKVAQNNALLFVLLVALCHMLLLWEVARGAGYVAERHTLLIVLCGSYFVATGLLALGARCASWPRLSHLGGATTWSAIMAFVMIAACIPAGMKSLHVNRAGHHAAGLWLAHERHQDDVVLDPFSWAEFYAGFIRYPEFHRRECHYIYAVVESIDNSPHPRLHLMPDALRAARQGELVYHWPENLPESKAKVRIFRCEGKGFWQAKDLSFQERDASLAARFEN